MAKIKKQKQSLPLFFVYIFIYIYSCVFFSQKSVVDIEKVQHVVVDF